MKFVTRFYIVVGLLLPYWYGVVSGYYTEHSRLNPPTNSNPDTYIHSGLFILTTLLFSEMYMEWKAAPEKEKAE